MEINLKIIDYDLSEWVKKEADKRNVSVDVRINQMLNEKKKEDKFWLDKFRDMK